LSVIQVNAEQPVPIWNLVANYPNQTILIVNQDASANITVGDAAVVAGDTSAQTIPPEGAISVPATQAWYAISDIDDGATIQVTLGGTDWTPGAAGIANAMIAAGIPTLIAQELSASGVSLLAQPLQMFNVGGVTQPGSGATSLVGWTIPNQAYKTGCYYQNEANREAGDAAFQSLVQRGNSIGKDPIVKVFWNQGDYHTSNNFNNLANYAADGTFVILCIWPNFTTVGGVTTVPASEITAISNWLTAITALGITGANSLVVLIQEPEVFVNHVVKATTAQYQAVLTQVTPTLTAAGYGMVPDIGSGGGIATAQSYANAAFASGQPIAMLASDFYYPQFNIQGGTQILTAMATIADAHAVPYGLFEFGIAPDNFPSNPNASAQYFGAITSFFQTRQQNNKPNGHFIWYDGQCSATGAGDLTAPILTAGDPRIALYQHMFDTLTSVSSSGTGGLTINATSTKTLTPVNPSPIGGLAPIEEMSYEIALGLIAGVGSTNPFCQVIVSWYEFDQLVRNQTIVDSVRFFIPMGTNGDANGPLIVHGKGRQRGSFVQVKVNNFDSVACTLQFLQMMDTSRPGTRDAWIWNSNTGNSPAVPGFTLANAAPDSLEVGRVTSSTIAHGGGSKSWLCGLFTGRVGYKISVPTGSTTNDVVFQIAPQPTNIYTGSPTYLQETLGNAGNTNQRGELLFSRGPVLVTITNNEAANDVTASFVIVGEETS
jgi:hypothetical protein